MENKKANYDQRKWFLLLLVALTPFGITEGNPSNHLNFAFVSLWKIKKQTTTNGSGFCFRL